jgi:thiosulfate reductase cytochrome b subunit
MQVLNHTETSSMKFVSLCHGSSYKAMYCLVTVSNVIYPNETLNRILLEGFLRIVIFTCRLGAVIVMTAGTWIFAAMLHCWSMIGDV